MEVWSDLVNLNLFANSIRKHAPPPTPTCMCTPTCACMCAPSCLQLTARRELCGLAGLESFPVCACTGTQREMTSVTIDRSCGKEKEQTWIGSI